jgi:hypothetical protein
MFIGRRTVPASGLDTGEKCVFLARFLEPQTEGGG